MHRKKKKKQQKDRSDRLEERSTEKDVDYIIGPRRAAKEKNLGFMLPESTSMQQNTVLTLVNGHFSVVPSSSVWTSRHPGIWLNEHSCLRCLSSCLVVGLARVLSLGHHFRLRESHLSAVEQILLRVWGGARDPSARPRAANPQL